MPNYYLILNNHTQTKGEARQVIGQIRQTFQGSAIDVCSVQSVFPRVQDQRVIRTSEIKELTLKNADQMTVAIICNETPNLESLTLISDKKEPFDAHSWHHILAENSLIKLKQLNLVGIETQVEKLLTLKRQAPNLRLFSIE